MDCQRSCQEQDFRKLFHSQGLGHRERQPPESSGAKDLARSETPLELAEHKPLKIGGLGLLRRSVKRFGGLPNLLRAAALRQASWMWSHERLALGAGSTWRGTWRGHLARQHQGLVEKDQTVRAPVIEADAKGRARCIPDRHERGHTGWARRVNDVEGENEPERRAGHLDGAGRLANHGRSAGRESTLDLRTSGLDRNGHESEQGYDNAVQFHLPLLLPPKRRCDARRTLGLPAESVVQVAVRTKPREESDVSATRSRGWSG